MARGSRSIAFDRIADRYDDTRGGLERGQVIADAIAPFLAAGNRVVEIGVGTGVIASGLAKGGRRVLGIDLSPAMLHRARARAGPSLILGDVAALPLSSADTDNVYGVWVLHLVGDPPQVLRECERVLRPGGRALFVAGGPRSAPNDEIAAIGAGLAPLRDRGDTPDRVTSWAVASGLRGLVKTETAWTFWEAPAAAALQLEERVLAFLWDVDDDTWRRVVQPVIDERRSLPHKQRPRHRVHRHDLLVFEKGQLATLRTTSP
jgi:SAM-dependent methyltransferase